MATRRSRIQFRPNVGPKAGKGPPASGSRPTTSKPKETDSKSISSVEATKDVKLYTVEADAVKVDVPAIDVQSGPISAPSVCGIQITSEVKISNEELICDKNSLEVEQQSTVERADEEKPKEPATLQADKETPVAKSETKPKYRSRFPKARPNLADSGRPKTSRPPISQSVTIPPVAVTADKSPVSRNIPEPVAFQENQAPLSPVKQSTTTTVEPQPPTQSLETSLKAETQRKSTETPTEVRPASIQRRRSESIEKKLEASPEKRKEHHSHRRLPSAFEPPNRQKLTMGDLIYWNPRKNGLKSKAKSKPVVNSPKKESIKSVPVAKEPEIVDPENEDVDDDLLPVPQVKIGPDGNIILNEESLVIDNQEKDTTQEMEIVEEDETRPCCGFYGNRIQSRRWNVMETKQFYRALATVGTDFTMLMKLFPGRTRREIKNKFKKEERFHRVLIDKAIDQRQKFSLAILEKFEQERKDYLDFVKSEEIKVKQQKITARLEKRKLREEKRKQRILLEKKENQLRRSQRKRRKTMYDDVPDDDVNEVLADRTVEITDELYSKREEVVEILVNMSYGCPSRPEAVNSSDDEEKESQEIFPFIPKKLKPDAVHNIVSDVQEDSTVDLEVFTPRNVSTPAEAIGLPSPTLNSLVNNAGNTQQSPRHVPPVIQVEQHQGQLEQLGSQFEAASRLQEQMADKKVQMVLVPEESAGQTVIHVYIVPDGAESVMVDGRTVLLSPTHTPCQGMMSPQPQYITVPETKSRPFQSPSTSLSSSQTSNSVPCASLDVPSRSDGISNSGKLASSGHSLLHHYPPCGRSFEMGSSSISALQQRSVKTEAVSSKQSVACKSPQRTTKTCQTEMTPTLKNFSGQKSFTPLPSPSNFHALTTVSNSSAEGLESSPVLDSCVKSELQLNHTAKSPVQTQQIFSHQAVQAALVQTPDIQLTKSKSSEHYSSVCVAPVYSTQKESLLWDPENKACDAIDHPEQKQHIQLTRTTDSSELSPSVPSSESEECLLNSKVVSNMVPSQEQIVFSSVKSEGSIDVNTVLYSVNELNVESMEYDSGVMCEPPPRTVVVDGIGEMDMDIVHYEVVRDSS